MMTRKYPHKIKHEELIQEVNVLGPWVHGYFNLGNGIIIEDKDILQKKRLFALREYLFNIITDFYGRKKLKDKTLCDVGCNTGYFIYELYKKFNFKNVLGLEPRKSNLDKAEFVSRFFKLPKKKFQLKEFDILDYNKTSPKSDIVIMMGVLHHIDNHIQALKKLYKMTKELCILETMVLTDDLNTNKVSQQLELKDSLYKNKKNKKKFGLIGYKLESDRLDGATIHSGIVGIPTTEVLLMMLKSVGFENAYVYRNEKHYRTYFQSSEWKITKIKIKNNFKSHL
jgi:2-polyprenyl-3-methyl-5-hydroxy-6-metoxy-1,4-benzoquinol methylase